MSMKSRDGDEALLEASKAAERAEAPAESERSIEQERLEQTRQRAEAAAARAGAGSVAPAQAPASGVGQPGQPGQPDAGAAIGEALPLRQTHLRAPQPIIDALQQRAREANISLGELVTYFWTRVGQIELLSAEWSADDLARWAQQVRLWGDDPKHVWNWTREWRGEARPHRLGRPEVPEPPEAPGSPDSSSLRETLEDLLTNTTHPTTRTTGDD